MRPAQAHKVLADSIAAFLHSREAAGCTAATLRVYGANLELFIRTAGVEELTGLTTATLENYLAGLRGRARELRQAARQRAQLADAYARRAAQYAAEARELRAAAARLARTRASAAEGSRAP